MLSMDIKQQSGPSTTNYEGKENSCNRRRDKTAEEAKAQISTDVFLHVLKYVTCVGRPTASSNGSIFCLLERIWSPPKERQEGDASWLSVINIELEALRRTFIARKDLRSLCGTKEPKPRQRTGD